MSFCYFDNMQPHKATGRNWSLVNLFFAGCAVDGFKSFSNQKGKQVMDYFKDKDIKTPKAAVFAFARMSKTLDDFCGLFDNDGYSLQPDLDPIYRRLAIQIKKVHEIGQPFIKDYNMYSSILLSSLTKSFKDNGFEGSNEKCLEEILDKDENLCEYTVEWVISYLAYVEKSINDEDDEDMTKDKKKRRI